MKWNDDALLKAKKDRVGERRTRLDFALFPFSIGKESRWLTFVAYEEVYKFYKIRDLTDSCEGYHWAPVKFVPITWQEPPSMMLMVNALCLIACGMLLIYEALTQY